MPERLICDDCRKPYDGPAYYTLGECAYPHEEDGNTCTDTFCPDCAGPYLDPDNPTDPRRPVE